MWVCDMKRLVHSPEIFQSSYPHNIHVILVAVSTQTTKYPLFDATTNPLCD